MKDLRIGDHHDLPNMTLSYDSTFSPDTQEWIQNCDSLLRECPEIDARLANPVLHFKGIRAKLPTRYARTPFASLRSHLRLAIVDQARLIRDLVKGSDLRSAELPKADVLVVSHRVTSPKVPPKNDADPYFGIIPDELRALEVKVVKVAIDQIPTYAATTSTDAFVLPRRESRRLECQFALTLAKDACRLLKKALMPGSIAGLRRTALIASAQSFSSASRMNLRLGHQICRSVASTGARIVLITFEGNAWERTCALAIRHRTLNCAVVAYQHAPALPGQHALFRPIGHRSDPDIILCSSLAGRTLIKEGWDKAPTRIETVGLLNAKVDAPLFSTRAATSPLEVLLAPDGTQEELLLFTGLASQLAVQYPSFQFTIRLHPITAEWPIVRAFHSIQRRQPNLSVSSASLSEDLERMQILLYRNSGVSIQACIQSTAPLVYVGQQFALDPLWSLRKSTAQPGTLPTSIESLASSLKNYTIHLESRPSRAELLGVVPKHQHAISVLLELL